MTFSSLKKTLKPTLKVFTRELQIKVLSSPKDFLVFSYPRSGTNYVRFLLANYLKNLNGDPNPVFFGDEINRIIPFWTPTHSIYMPNVRLGITHRPPQKWDQPKHISVFRNPRDVLISFYVYKQKKEKKNYSSFSSFVRSPEGAPLLEKSSQKALNNSHLLTKYEDISHDPASFIFQFCDLLNIHWDREAAAQSIINSDRDVIMRQEKKFRENHETLISNPHSKEHVSPSLDDLKYIEQTCKSTISFFNYQVSA